MFSQADSFTLFGVQIFDNFVREKCTAISLAIENFSDDEILGSENNLEQTIQRLISNYSITPLSISFDKESVRITPYTKDIYVRDVFNRQALVPRAYVRYSIPVSGNLELLKTCPYSYLQTKIKVEFKNNYLEFELDTRYATVEFPEEKKREINNAALNTKDFILKTSTDLNNSVEKFNAGLISITHYKVILM